jgi:anti-sigma B factor antagonist
MDAGEASPVASSSGPDAPDQVAPHGGPADETEPDALVVAVEADGDALVLRAAGELDVATTPELRAAIDRAVAGGCAELRLDLAGIEFIDSTGISALLAAREQMQGRGAVRLVGTSTAVDRALDLTGLADLFGDAE